MIAVNIIACPCCIQGACIETKTDHLSLWQCQTCGYQTNSRMISGSDLVEGYHISLPNLLQDLRKEANSLVWYPSVVNIENVGMVFPDGRSVSDWKWTAVLAVEVPEEERPKFKGATHMMDTANLKQFDRLEFMDALDHINFYKKTQ